MTSTIQRKLSFTKKYWEILQKNDLQNLEKHSSYGAEFFEELSIQLQGDNIRDKFVLNCLIKQIELFFSLKNLEIYFGYLNIVEKDTFRVIFDSISTLKQLQKLSLTFDSQSVCISTLKDFQQIAECQKLIPQLDELVLILRQDTLIDFEDSNNLISLFIANQNQMKTFKLEIICNNLKNNFMMNLTRLLSKCPQLRKLDITIKDSGTPLDLQPTIQNLFFLNLSSLSIQVERCQIQESESGFCVFDNPSYSQLKNLEFRFAEIENIGNIITRILSKISLFQNLNNFYLCLDKIQGLENLKMDQNYSIDAYSHLKTINIEIFNSIVSCSLNKFIFNSLFYDNQHLIVSQSPYKIILENCEIGGRNYKFIYDSFKNDDFANQIQELNIFTQQNQHFKRLQLEEQNIVQLALQKNIISTEELCIKLAINQEIVNNLALFLNSIDTVSLKVFQLDLNDYQKQLFNSDQLVKSLIRLIDLLNYTSFDVLLDLTKYPYISEINDKNYKFNIKVKDFNQPFTILNQLIRILQGLNLDVKVKLIMNDEKFNIISSKFTAIQQDNTHLQNQQQDNYFDLDFKNVQKELHLGVKFDFDNLKYQKDISTYILKINCCKNFKLSNVLQRFTNIQYLEIIMKEAEEIEQIQLFLLEILNLTSLISLNISIQCSYNNQKTLNTWLKSLDERDLQIKQMRVLQIKTNNEKVLLNKLIRQFKRLVIY